MSRSTWRLTALVGSAEAHKDTVTVNELSAIGPVGLNPAYTNSITAPVLILDGQDDLLFCVNNTQVNCASWSSMNAFEQSFFPAAASLTTESVPQTGHDLALSTSAPLSFGLIAAWMATH